MRNAHHFVFLIAGIGLLSVVLLVAMPIVSTRMPPGMYERTYDFQNKAANVLVRIIPLAEACAIFGLFLAACRSRGKIFHDDRWLLPTIGVLLLGMAIAGFFLLRAFIGGGFP